MNTPKFHKIWIEQCEATREIKLRFGIQAAFDYLVAEKLLNFADVAVSHPEFASELPGFVARVRSMFTPEEIRFHLARIECEQRQYDIEDEDELDEKDELILENSAVTAERARQFATIKELLTAAELGTS